MSIPRASAKWYRRTQTYLLASDVGLVLGAGWLALQKIFQSAPAVPVSAVGNATAAAAVNTTAPATWWTDFVGSATSSKYALSVVVGAGLVKAGISAYEKISPSKADDLVACLHVLHAMLMTTVTTGDPDPGLRITLHIPVAGEQLEQLCDYIGNEGKRCKKKRGRKTSVKSGIIGDAYRKEDETLRMNRANENGPEYLHSLEVEWHFTEKEAKSVDQAVMSAIAVPLPDNSGVAAILYADSTRQHFFTDARKQMIEDQCRAIAVFIGKRYSS